MTHDRVTQARESRNRDVARAWLAAIDEQARTGGEHDHAELGRVIDALGRIVALARTPLPANDGEVSP